VWGQAHKLTTLPTRGKNPKYVLNRRLGGPQIQYGCFGEEKISITIYIHQLDATLFKKQQGMSSIMIYNIIEYINI
jgi:hypothetical protein